MTEKKCCFLEKGIEHKGFIKEIGLNTMKVSVTSVSACAQCHSKSACTLSDVQEKIIEVSRPEWNHQLNQEVNITMQKSMGFWALFYGYLFPFVFVMIALFITYEITGNQGLAGLASLGILIPYYFGLFLFNGYLKKKFIFTVKQF
ncbi:MAG: hypothetical protein A2W91_13805 [Bacteroidetes bacterium GWF2_38_335]|nr:MAG: hypothetical protein A2W91_13805 [Bacteroidetes bacterium GWF2_38_335]OFY77791.1 MAG: hypothetical protein A2281_15495 [Bacteroidetes bacterium RIFOXYA12_FULL_38_20]HBS87404.1 hypothetical protein [Bacteroidales bacterium]